MATQSDQSGELPETGSANLPQAHSANLAQAHSANLPAMLNTLQALVECESPTSDLASAYAITELAEVLANDWLPTPARVEIHGGRPVWRWGPDQPEILLLGHLDTVWPIGTLSTIPFAINDDRVTGPGVFDMKVGVVQGWTAIKESGITESSGVGMLLTTDEETGSHASRELIAQSITKAKAVIVLEPSLDGALKTRRKGTSNYLMRFHGVASHAGLDPERGVNALVAAAELILATQQWGNEEAETSVTPTVSVSGTTTNTVPDLAEVHVDVRAWNRAEQERVDHLVRAFTSTLPVTIKIIGGIDRPAMESAMSAELFTLASLTNRELGYPDLTECAVGGASDGNLTAAAGIPTIDGMGAVGDGAHADFEWASISAIPHRTELLAKMLIKLLADPPRNTASNHP
jgi:glutamate carboxypeptidase